MRGHVHHDDGGARGGRGRGHDHVYLPSHLQRLQHSQSWKYSSNVSLQMQMQAEAGE